MIDQETPISEESTYSDIWLTVIIPTYKRQRYILELLSEFERNYMFLQGLELILVSGDEDETVSELSQALARLAVHIQTELIFQCSRNAKLQSGLNDAIIRGILRARGTYLTYIADDDCLDFSFLSNISRFLSLKKPLICRFGWYDGAENKYSPRREAFRNVAFPGSYFLPHHMGAILRTESTLRVYWIMCSALDLSSTFRQEIPEVNFIKTEKVWLLIVSLVLYSHKSNEDCLVSNIPFGFQRTYAQNISQHRMQYPWWTPPFLWEQLHARLFALEFLAEIPAFKVRKKDRENLKSLMFRDVVASSYAFYGKACQKGLFSLMFKLYLSDWYLGVRERFRQMFRSI